MEYIIASVGAWNKEIFKEISNRNKGHWYFCSTPDELNILLGKVSPAYIFFPHWNWIVPNKIIKKYRCICFHMTDLPYGRGGSPLQNLIIRGFEKTMLSALRMEEGVDTGPIYYKKYLSLHGSAYDIYKRSGRLCMDMIGDFIKDDPNPVPQHGMITNFKRRTPDQSQIPDGLSLEEIYNYIRMLDAPGYPKAFLEIDDYRLEFESSEHINGKLSAKVNFIKKVNNV
jgi:methionyl-tRNA formyltransferase